MVDVVPPADAAQAYVFGSLAGHWTATMLLLAIASVCGYAVTRIARQAAAPEGQLPYIGTTPGVRRALGAATALAVLASGWSFLWTGFHRLTLTERSVVLQYHTPSRQRVLAREDVVSARWEPGPRFSRVFVLRTRDGTQYSSMQTSLSSDEARAVVDALRAQLRVQPVAAN